MILQNQKKVFVLSLHFNGNNSFLFVNLKLHQLKAKDLAMKLYPLCLVNIWKDFTINNIKKTALKGNVTVFSVYYKVIDASHILDIHRYLLKESMIKNI